MSPIGRPLRRGHWADHPYVSVGSGDRTLLIVPGLNDPLCRVADRRWFSLLVATFCGRYAAGRRVAMVSRPPGLPEDLTIAEMAGGYERVLEEVGPVDLLGLSMGGFVVQHLAATSDRVERAILGLSAYRLGEHGRAVLERWRDHAENERWRPICDEAGTMVAGGLKRPFVRGAVNLYGALASLSSVDREDFLVSTDACLAFDGTDVLTRIDVPTLVVGGSDDPFFTEGGYRKTAASIDDGRLAIMPEVGHEAVLDRRRAFDGAITRFLRYTE